MQSQTDYDSQINEGTVYPWHSYYGYDANGHLTSVDINDGRPRDVTFIVDANGMVLQRHEDEVNREIGDPMEIHYYFNGMAVGDVSNNGTSDVDYATSIAEHTATYGSGPFRNGALNSANVNYADFDQSYDPINGLNYESTSSRYTVQSGDTLQNIAYTIWGDASFWYMIADANGLDGSETLTAGVDLIIPNKVHNSHNSSDTYRVYDPNQAIGNTSPTAAKPPKKPHNDCGIMGQILLAVIAVAVAWYLAPLLVPTLGTTLAGAVAGAAGSIVSQGVGVATGIQSKFDWGAVAMAAIGGGVQGAMAPGGLFGKAGAFSGVTNTFVQGFLRGATASVLTQGIGVATGLQRRFDWAGVAAAGVGQGVSSYVSSVLPGGGSLGNQFIGGAAGLIANAATRSLVNGSDFGDNIIAALPDFVAQTIGNALAEGLDAQSALDSDLSKDTGKKSDDTSEMSNELFAKDASKAGVDYSNDGPPNTLNAMQSGPTSDDQGYQGDTVEAAIATSEYADPAHIQAGQHESQAQGQEESEKALEVLHRFFAKHPELLPPTLKTVFDNWKAEYQKTDGPTLIEVADTQMGRAFAYPFGSFPGQPPIGPKSYYAVVPPADNTIHMYIGSATDDWQAIKIELHEIGHYDANAIAATLVAPVHMVNGHPTITSSTVEHAADHFVHTILDDATYHTEINQILLEVNQEWLTHHSGH